MAKNEDGEFELILGNRQLLSVFFIVVILLGVFFTMGYIVGRNSAAAPQEVAATPKTESKPLVVNSPAREASAPTSLPPNETPAASEPEKTEKPAAETPKPKPAPVQPEPVKPKPPAPAPAASSDLPAVGQTYLQLAATSEHEARLEVDVLRKKGFTAIASEIPEKRGTFRVLVGPVPEGGTNKMKSDLNAAGFPGDKAIRRTF